MTRLWQQARQELRDDPVALQRLEYWTWTFENFLKEAQGHRPNARKTS